MALLKNYIGLDFFDYEIYGTQGMDLIAWHRSLRGQGGIIRGWHSAVYRVLIF